MLKRIFLSRKEKKCRFKERVMTQGRAQFPKSIERFLLDPPRVNSPHERFHRTLKNILLELLKPQGFCDSSIKQIRKQHIPDDQNEDDSIVVDAINEYNNKAHVSLYGATPYQAEVALGLHGHDWISNQDKSHELPVKTEQLLK